MADVGQVSVRLTLDTDAFRRNAAAATEQMRHITDSLEDIGENSTEAARNTDTLGSSLSKIAQIVGIAVIANGIKDIGKAAIQAGIEYESAFAGVKKTIDATDEELQQFSDGIRDMAKSMPATASEIAGIAEAAGQLGIQNKSILSFTETMTNLGVATDLAGEEAATALARVANITQMSQDDFGRLGSSIVALGNESCPVVWKHAA